MRSWSGLHLSKCYVDCVGDAGDWAIAYHARLCWGPVALGYASLLGRRGPDGPWSASTLRPGPTPTADPGYVAWNTPALHLSVSARSRSEPFGRRLLEGTAGTVDWDCLAPCAEVSLRSGSGAGWSGLGYGERLEVRCPSWRLPIEQLRWGRFLTPTRTVVWIGWWGAEPRTLVFDNGRCQADAEIGDGEVRFGRSRLTLDRQAVVRDADLAEILKPLARLRALPLAEAARIHETKWLSRGTLHDPTSSEPVDGWVIHELVVFP